MTNTEKPKPFLKWAGGKTQLWPEIEKRLPADLSDDYIYFEPFVGGGAVFFKLCQKFKFKKVYLGDINRDLILTYNIIRNKPKKLISELNELQDDYEYGEIDNKDLFYDIRVKFNKSNDNIEPLDNSEDNIIRASRMIFLNKTCFNGLYRVNKKGGFNVPFANPKNPLILDKNNINAVSNVLKNVTLYADDFSKYEYEMGENSFVYLDPPYKPINGKKRFEGYTKSGFDDDEQIRLSEFCKEIHRKGAKFLLSNSKPDEVFFEKYYKDFNRETVYAKRAINSDGKKRGAVEELLIYNNYKLKKH